MRAIWNRFTSIPKVNLLKFTVGTIDEGLKRKYLFFYQGVFVLHGFFVFMLFIFCWVLNRRSILSGIIGVLCYFYNHGEATRVMWNPALRENFSFPFHLLQVASLTYMLNQVKTTRPAWMYFTASTLLYLLPWQFAQFSLATQVASLYAMFALGFIRRQKLIEVISAQTCALGTLFSGKFLCSYNLHLAIKYYFNKSRYLLCYDVCQFNVSHVSLRFTFVCHLGNTPGGNDMLGRKQSSSH